jgi:hypothetical protein
MATSPTAKIATALNEVMAKVGYVQKTGKNAFHGYKYAGEADLLDKLRPAMVEAGLLLLPSVTHVTEPDAHGNVTVEVEYTLVHKDGDVWPFPLKAAGCGNDRAKNGSVGDKGVYKAITGANKYMLFKLFQIETGDDPEVVIAHDKMSDADVIPISNGPRKTAHAIKKDRPKDWEMVVDLLRACTTYTELKETAASELFMTAIKDWPKTWCDLIREEEYTPLAKALKASEESVVWAG